MQAELKEPPTVTIAEIERDLREYPRMTRDIQRITAELQEISSPAVSRMDAMPRPQTGRHGDPTANAVVRRDRKWRQLERMKERVDRIDRAAETITDTREMILLDMLLDGAPQRTICNHMRLSRSYLYEIRADLIYNLYQAAKGR